MSNLGVPEPGTALKMHAVCGDAVAELTRELEQARHQVAHLTRALERSREIGAAIGILMALHKVSQGEAFGLLRRASQNTNVKVWQLALEVVETGTLPVRPHPS